jgi:hypothetical protein
MTEGRRYSDEEVRAILERAIRRDSAGGVSHDELVSAAAEIGVSRAALEEAANEIERGRGDREARERILARRRSGFFAHLWAFLGVNGFLLLLNLLTTPATLWFLFPALGWGLGLFFHARAAFSREVTPRALAREAERRERQDRRARKRAEAERRAEEKRVRKERLERGAAELGAAVEEGVGVLMSKVAEEIRKKSNESSRPESRIRVEPPARAGASAPDPVAEAEAEAEAIAEADADRPGDQRQTKA